MNLYTQQSRNITRTWLLMGAFLVVIVGLGYVVSMYYGNAYVLYGAIIFSVVMNVVSFWYSDKIVLKLSGAQEAKREAYTDLHNLVENLAITAGLPKPKVYVVHDAAPNAFATGRDPQHGVVAVTTGLLSLLDRTELEGVIAHELSHIGNRDTLIATAVVVLVGFVSLIADFFIRGRMFGDRNNRIHPVLMVIGIIFIILSPLIAKMIQLAISRRREFLADASGALLTRYPEGLAKALQKISAQGISMHNAHKATAHLFIANPFGVGVGKKVSGLFSTHPSTDERVHALVGERHI